MHKLISEGKIFLSAGVFDVLSAKIAEAVGFRAVVLSGYAASASYLGEPDIGLLTQTEVLDLARRICRAVSIPVIVDGDTGYGGTLNVKRMVEELIACGAAGIILEDQTWPKRCGHLHGKNVIPAEEHAAKIRTAVSARKDRPFIIVGRTDALEVLGLEEAARRGRLYREAGADLIFVEAPRSREELEYIAREIPAPLVVNVVEGGVTPVLDLEDYHSMGFVSVGYVLTGIFAAAQALRKAYAHLLEKGTSKGLEGELMSFGEFTGLLGLEEKLEEDRQFLRP
ncbi:isocitrate lyase/PEP mutase family protein [Candidatus Solincola tengchongensis]|uniref:isocitrate lyase/PEP mutase family protein n=1 Tax=Candidatus Solincola tengchongensis TaxID=2900693 RepID=UPI00257C0F92|nr:isocitrate lyase/PEP mutase family protein [Candidatus Solincola tengchongensis]